jgi:hypothetical protein
MLGGGFLKQGADSAKYNRSLLSKEPHKAFERKEGTAKINLKFRDDIKMSAQVETELQREIIANNRKELRQRVASAIIALIILISGLVAMFS